MRSSETTSNKSEYKPTRKELLQAYSRTLEDLIAPGLDVLFCGINPGLYSAATGYHFARPGNRFWPALYASGFTERLYHPYEQEDLLKQGLGITNVVARATASAEELSVREIKSGFEQLKAKVLTYSPKYLAILGISIFRIATGERSVSLALQREKIHNTKVWILPNPSGLNAHYTPPKLTDCFRQLLINL